MSELVRLGGNLEEVSEQAHFPLSHRKLRCDLRPRRGGFGSRLRRGREPFLQQFLEALRGRSR